MFEQTTPQYPLMNVWNLQNNGYRSNELIYACINRRAKAVAEAPLRIYETVPSMANASGQVREERKDHPIRRLIEHPCEGMDEAAFWRATEIYLNVAGFAAWEKEYDRAGRVIRLWPMAPHYCAFMRGDGQPLRAIRYMPYGLPPVDVPRENVVLFQYFDPVWPLLRALSPSAVASRVSSVDNNATDFLKLFFERGSVVNGLLTTEQPLTEAQAQNIRRMWREKHGGIGNWTDPAVLGSGTKYQATQMDFRSMQFSEIDARDEARICSVVDVPPILVGA